MIQRIIGSDSNDDDHDLDPDWRKTPIFKRLQKLKRDRFTLRTENERGVKRNSDGHVKCSCKGVCKNKLCGCRKIGSKCTKECKCDHSACKNQDQISKRLYCDSSSESVYENRDPDEEIFKKPREMPGVKKCFLSPYENVRILASTLLILHHNVNASFVIIKVYFVNTN